MNRFLSTLAKTVVAIVILSTLFPKKVMCQDLSTIMDKEMLTISGNLSIDQMFTPQLWGNTTGRDPYSYFIVGGLNMSFYGFSMPLNFSYSNQNLGFTHPFTFNQFGAQPSYKWVKTYVGYNSVSFSPYTLGGHQFCGFGFELTPPQLPVSVGFVYGRFLKATEFEPPQNIPAYKRMGVGLKASASLPKANFNTSAFYAWDEANSIQPLPDSLGIFPKENLAFSFDGGVIPLTGLNLSFSVGNSVMTDDKFSAISNERKFWGGLFPTRNSTSSYWAYKVGFNYSISLGTLGLSYEHVQPGYNTLGAYYFVDDLENITLNSAIRILDGKLNLGGNFGVQRDNLNDQKMFANNRLVGAGSISYSPNQSLSLNSSFSSFTSYTHLRSVFDHINNPSPYENLDTLNFTQVNRSTTLGATYAFGNESVKHTSNISFSGNQSLNKQEGTSNGDDMVFINAGLTHAITLSETGWAFTVSTFYSTNSSPLGTNNTFGPFVNTTKSFMEGKLRLGVGSAYNKSWLNEVAQSTNINMRLTGVWSFKEGHSLNCSGAYYHISSAGSSMGDRKELVFNLTYSYNFQQKFSPKNKPESNTTE